MPQLNFLGVKKKDLLVISKDLVDDLAVIATVSRDSILLNVNETDVVFDGELIIPPASVDVYWFDRPQEIQDKFAKALTKHIISIGYPDILIMFHTIIPEKMYTKGEHH